MKSKKPKRPKPRGVWKINPRTRVKPSKKIYKRTRLKKETQRRIRESRTTD